MRYYIFFISIFILPGLYAQQAKFNYGDISYEEMKMTSYAKDKDAKAVILYDRGESFFIDSKQGYDIRFERCKRIKVFDKSAKGIAVVSIPYFVDGYGRSEEINAIQAVTYNLVEGSIVKKELSLSSIFDEQISSKWFNKKFVFPDVQDGSVLEFRYVLESPFHFNLPDWTFQNRVPTIYSEYVVGMIPFYEYVYSAQGISKFNFHNTVLGKRERKWGQVVKSNSRNIGSGVEFQDLVHTYVMKDIPAFVDESFISSINDYLIKMDFQLAKFHSPKGGTSEIISTWEDLNKELLKNDNFGKYIKNCSKVAKGIIKNDLSLEGLDDSEKAIAIIEYVKNSFKWDKHLSKYSSQSAKDFFKLKKGNIADINLFLLALLRKAGVEARPVILSTRKHGRIQRDYPFDHFTNYVLVYVPSTNPFLADASEYLLPYDKIPPRCLNGKGLIVDKDDRSKWISLVSGFPQIEKNVLKLELNLNSSELISNVQITYFDYESFRMRSKYNDDIQVLKKLYKEKVGYVNSISTKGFKTVSEPYLVDLDCLVDLEQIGNSIVIKPFLDLPISANFLTQKKRDYPVDFINSWEKQFESILNLPDNYTVSELPNSFDLDNGFVKINLSFVLDGEFLISKGSYRFKKDVYQAKEYSTIKYYLDQIVEYFNQSVVVEKNN